MKRQRTKKKLWKTVQRSEKQHNTTVLCQPCTVAIRGRFRQGQAKSRYKRGITSAQTSNKEEVSVSRTGEVQSLKGPSQVSNIQAEDSLFSLRLIKRRSVLPFNWRYKFEKLDNSSTITTFGKHILLKLEHTQ